MPRSIWKGVISFGMVSIPVKLYGATQSKDISFHLLHKTDMSRLRQLRWCPVEEKEVGWDDIVRGYEFSRDQYVPLTDEDFEKLPLPSKHTIELSAFVKAEEIDPVFYEKSYYLEPDEAAMKPFALLIRALQETARTAVAKIAIRNREQLCVLRPSDGHLMLETLYYPDEVRVEEAGKAAEVDVSEGEMKMAFTLIDLLSGSFEPEKYHDEYRKALMSLIEAKLQGQEVVSAPAPPPQVTDLMAALKASVEAAKKRREEEPEPAAASRNGRRQKAG